MLLFSLFVVLFEFLEVKEVAGPVFYGLEGCDCRRELFKHCCAMRLYAACVGSRFYDFNKACGQSPVWVADLYTTCLNGVSHLCDIKKVYWLLI